MLIGKIIPYNMIICDNVIIRCVLAISALHAIIMAIVFNTIFVAMPFHLLFLVCIIFNIFQWNLCRVILQ